MSSEEPARRTIISSLLHFAEEIGLISVYHSPLDTKLLCLQRFFRFFAYGGTTLILVAFLSEIGNSDECIGLFMTLTLVGDVFISFVLTLYADKLGRKAVLVIGSSLMVVSGIVFACTNSFLALLAAAIFGVISPSGNEVGPFRAVEESTLAHLTPSAARSDIFAWYTLIGYAGTAVGTLVSGWVVQHVRDATGDLVFAYRIVFYIYAAQGFVKFLLACGLSKNVELKKEQEVETDSVTERAPLLNTIIPDGSGEQEVKRKTFLSISKENMPIYIQLCLLFALDSFASGLATTTWVTYFFKAKFNLDGGDLGSLFSGLAIVTACSVLVSSSIAKRIGNIKAMVFTHLPSNVGLALIPVPSTPGPAIAFLILRASFQSMDTAPRTAFMTTVILPKERTAVMGMINVMKTMSQSVGPIVTGVLAGKDLFGVSLMLAAGSKVIYDLSLLVLFSGHESQKKEAEIDENEGEEERL